jgi:hypothetical protein
MENKRSTPVSVPMDAEDYQVMAKAGFVAVEQKSFESVRLAEKHFDAIDKIISSLPSVAGLRSNIGRSAAIRYALHKYCESLCEGNRYISFSDLVKDALLWTAGELLDAHKTSDQG